MHAKEVMRLELTALFDSKGVSLPIHWTVAFDVHYFNQNVL